VIDFKQIDSVKLQGKLILEDPKLQDGLRSFSFTEANNYRHISFLSSSQSLSTLTDASIMPLLNSIKGINEIPNIEDAIAPIIMQICEATDWDYGEIWIPSDNSTILELSNIFHIASNTADLLSLEQFRLCSEGFVVSPEEGLPGRVWSSGQSEWIADATAESESYWLRNQLARAFDLSAGFGVPIIATDGEKSTLGERVQAVIVFFKLGT
jgi:hypothetical protein